MNALETVGCRLAEAQDQVLEADPRQLARVRARLLAPPPRPVPLGWGPRVALILVGAGAVAALVVALRPAAGPDPVGFRVVGGAAPVEVSRAIAATEAPVALDFSDGSQVTLRPGARARVLATTAAGARLALDSGAIDVYVRPGEGTAWAVEAGGFAVQVTGTRFDVGWDPAAERFDVGLSEGSVAVTGPLLGAGRRVAAGERLAVDVRRGDVRFDTVGLEMAEGAPSRRQRRARRGRGAPDAAKQIEAAPAEIPDASWQELAADGRYGDAMAVVDHRGFAGLVAEGGAAELLTLADTARLARDWRRARVVYLELRERFAKTSQAARAAFFLGRIDFDRRSAYHEAAAWFERYLEAAPRGAFAKQALGRLIEAWSEAGEGARAKAAAERYLSRYPGGPHADFAKRLAGG